MVTERGGRSGRIWRAIGYFASAAWMGWVLFETKGDPSHPFFDLIFVVPLGAWIVGLIVSWIIGAVRGRGGRPPPPPP